MHYRWSPKVGPIGVPSILRPMRARVAAEVSDSKFSQQNARAGRGRPEQSQGISLQPLIGARISVTFEA